MKHTRSSANGQELPRWLQDTLILLDSVSPWDKLSRLPSTTGCDWGLLSSQICYGTALASSLSRGTERGRLGALHYLYLACMVRHGEAKHIVMRLFARSQHCSPFPVAPTGLDTHVALLPLAQLCDQMRASERGLTQVEAQERLLAVGPNEPVVPRRGNGMWHMLAFATNPLVVMLLLASLVSGLLHDVANAVIIALMVLLSMVLNFRLVSDSS